MVHHDGPREPEIPLPSYLRRRGHTWFLRWKWPSRLAAFGFSGELIRSLRTSDFRIARRRALTLVLKIDAMISSTDLPKRAELESAIRRWIDDSVWRQEIKRAETGGLDFLECHEIEKMGREDARELDGLFRYASNMFAPQAKAAITGVLTGGTPNELHRSVITEAARQIGITTDPDTVAERLVERTILRGYATLLDELRHTITDIPKVSIAEEKPAPPASFIFTEFWKSFEQHKLDNREWKADTASNAEGTKNVFDKLFPAVTVAQLVATPIASDFKSKLMLLPRHYARGERKKMSADKLIALGRTLPMRDQMQAATANKHFNNFSEYWSYLVTQKKIAADIQNPFLGLHIPLKRGRKARNERNNWTPTLEKALFESPLYVGCASIHRRAVPGHEIHRDGLFWMPLLARTMGVRETRFVTRWLAASSSKKRAKDRFGIWKLLMERTPARKETSRLPNWCSGWAFLNSELSVAIPQSLCFQNLSPKGRGSVAPRHLPTVSD